MHAIIKTFLPKPQKSQSRKVYLEGKFSKREVFKNKTKKCEIFHFYFSILFYYVYKLISVYLLLSSPGPKPLVPNPLVRNHKPRGLGLTLKSHRPPPPPPPPPPHPLTFKHEGRVPHQKSKRKKGSEWSPLLVQQKNSGGQQEEGHGVVHHVQGEHHQS